MIDLLHPRVNGSALTTAKASVQSFLDRNIMSAGALTVVEYRKMVKAIIGECTYS